MDLRALAVAIPLFVAGAWSTREAELARRTPRPPPGPTSVLGGFAAIAANTVWIRAERAIQTREEDRAHELLRMLVDLEPQLVSASRYAAWEIGWNSLFGYEDAKTRWSLAREAIGILSRAVERNPRSSAAHANRALYLELLATDARLAGSYAEHVNPAGPLADAFESGVRALDLDAEELEAAWVVRRAGTRLGGAAARAGRWDDARVPLRGALRGVDAELALAADEIAPDQPEWRGALEGRAVLEQLLAVAEAPEDRRPALLAAFRAAHPEVLGE